MPSTLVRDVVRLKTELRLAAAGATVTCALASGHHRTTPSADNGGKSVVVINVNGHHTRGTSSCSVSTCSGKRNKKVRTIWTDGHFMSSVIPQAVMGLHTLDSRAGA